MGSLRLDGKFTDKIGLALKSGIYRLTSPALFEYLLAAQMRLVTAKSFPLPDIGNDPPAEMHEVTRLMRGEVGLAQPSEDQMGRQAANEQVQDRIIRQVAQAALKQIPGDPNLSRRGSMLHALQRTIHSFARDRVLAAVG
jgi:hypothetical protein